MATDLTSIGYKTSTIEEVALRTPAAFVENKSPKVSERYSFVPTYELLNAFDKLGWEPSYSRQNGTGPYARHMVRLVNSGLGFMDLKSDKVRPQIVLDNSHNGTSPAQIHMGLFRLVCTNGLVVAMPGMFTSVKLRHVGIDMTELKELMEVVANQYTLVGQHISDMQRFSLDNAQREDFVLKAIAAREPHVFVKEDGTIDIKKANTILKPSQILEPLRGEDKKEDLWTVFNVVQERLVKGEFERQTMAGRKTHPRGINNATRHINFNKTLWTIAESYMQPVDATELKRYTNAKGVTRDVEVLEDLGNGLSQVKDATSGLVYAVATNKLS
jgi:hypothetical protein